MTQTKTGPRHGDSRGRQHLSVVTNDTAPDVITLAGDTVVTSAGRIHRAPDAGPAGEMLDRLAERVGPNGLILIADGEPSWSYLLRDPDGWAVSGGPGWFTVMKGGCRLRVGMLGEMMPENDPLLGPDLVSTTIRHQKFGDLLGVPFYADGGATGALLLDATVNVKGAPPLRAWKEPGAPRVTEGPWLGPWKALNRPAGSGRVQLDKNAQYLCAANSTLLPLDGLRRAKVPYRPGTQEQVGLWFIEVPANPEPRLPHPMGATVSPGSWAWVAQPTVDMLRDMGVEVTANDAWLCPRSRSRRVLTPWYERLRDARAEVTADNDDAQAVRNAIKDTYSRGVGCLDRESRRWFRPDWKAFLLSQARMGLYRAMLRAGREEDRWPVETRTDSVTYEGDVPDSYRVGPGMGEWKVTRL